MKNRFDIVIIGAGFSGLVCARIAAERGLTVAVVDRKPEPGARIHTTGIIVKEAAAELDIPPELVRKVPGVRVYTPGLAHVDLSSPGYYFLATDTPALLRWLAAQAADAGARLFFGTAFAGARRDDGWTILESPAIRGRFLIAADGARSAVARHFGLGLNRRLLVGVEAEFEGVEGLDPDRLHCFLDSELAPGYLGWAVPGVGVTQIGLACRRDAKPRLNKLVDKLSRVFDFSNARITGRRSGPIPAGGAVRPLYRDGVILLGDAAGLVSPLTAGGIHPALYHGRRAAEIIADHLQHGGPAPGPAITAEYPRYRWKSMMRRALDLDPPNWLYNWSLGLPPTRALAKLVYFHRKGLKSGAAWRDLFGRKG